MVHALVVVCIVFLLSACGNPIPPSTPTPKPLSAELVFYDWEEDMPQSVLDAFTEEYGVKITYETYESQEEAIANIKAGDVYDVVVMESRFIPLMHKENLISKLNRENLPNSKNISANFRELAYDPGNQYSIPYNWGTTGLVFRSDLVERPINRWADLWDPRFAGHVGLWMGQPRELIGLTLKSLGYSANSENPQELGDALERLLAIKPTMLVLEDFALDTSAEALASGEVTISMGFAGDVLAGAELNPNIQYVLPIEGALLWNDTFIIPANSPNQHTAELFLNFLLQPQINAMITNENMYATPNEAAFEFIDSEILQNPLIFPANTELSNAELILPLTPAGQLLYDEIWKQFRSER